MAQVPAVGQGETHEGVPGLEQGVEDRGVGLRAGMGLDVGVLGAEELLGPVDGQLLGDVDELTADVVTSTVHKTLGGPRSGIILCREEHAKAINSAVFPGQQGGPLMHVIAAKAVALGIAATEGFRERQERTIAGAQAVAGALTTDAARAAGVDVLTGGTDVHLVLVDLRESELDGQAAEDRLHEIGITVNRNAVPFDPRPPMVTSGLRIGTSALATRGLGAEDFAEVGEIIAEAIAGDFEGSREELAERVAAIAARFPLYENLGAPAAA